MNALLELNRPCDPHSLMPGGTPSPAVVLFWRTGQTEAAEMRAKFAKKSWPHGYRTCVVHLDESPELRSWFNLGNNAALAIVQQGVLLAYELKCDDVSCRRLLDVAQHQLSMMRDEL